MVFVANALGLGLVEVDTNAVLGALVLGLEGVVLPPALSPPLLQGGLDAGAAPAAAGAAAGDAGRPLPAALALTAPVLVASAGGRLESRSALCTERAAPVSGSTVPSSGASASLGSASR